MDAEDSIHLARGHALDALTILLLGESINTATKLSPSIGNAFMEIVDDVLMDKGVLAKNREDLLNRTLLRKTLPGGTTHFMGPQVHCVKIGK